MNAAPPVAVSSCETLGQKKARLGQLLRNFESSALDAVTSDGPINGFSELTCEKIRMSRELSADIKKMDEEFHALENDSGAHGGN